jgi:hypothetical protein
MALRPR